MSADALLSGLLKDFNLVEVLQVMELGGKTGAIQLKQDSGHTAILYFNQGKLANCSEFDPGALTVGDVLQQLRMATREQIDWAFSQQLHDVVGKRIGTRLIAVNVINEQQLREALKTKALWTARELALWNEGTYEFIASPNIEKLLPYGEKSLEIDVMRITLEMVRYSEEWKDLRPFLPDGVRTKLQLSPTLPRTMHFYARIMNIFMHVNRLQSVRRIASAMQVPELDMARELAQLVQQYFLVPLPQQTFVRGSSKKMLLPDPAEKLRLEHFQLLDLIVRMEQTWDKQQKPEGQLAALADFVNWTMSALAEACRENGIVLDPNTLRNLLENENLSKIGVNYYFLFDQNYIDVEHFSAFCDEIMLRSNDFKKAKDFYEEASFVFQRILSAIFESINARVANPLERLENKEVWEAMLEHFSTPTAY